MAVISSGYFKFELLFVFLVRSDGRIAVSVKGKCVWKTGHTVDVKM